MTIYAERNVTCLCVQMRKMRKIMRIKEQRDIVVPVSHNGKNREVRTGVNEQHKAIRREMPFCDIVLPVWW